LSPDSRCAAADEYRSSTWPACSTSLTRRGTRISEFTFPAQDGVTGILVNATLLNKGDVQYEGYIRNGQQTLVLNQTPVSGPGVQPAS
jgi:hypothetical protein